MSEGEREDEEKLTEEQIEHTPGSSGGFHSDRSHPSASKQRGIIFLRNNDLCGTLGRKQISCYR